LVQGVFQHQHIRIFLLEISLHFLHFTGWNMHRYQVRRIQIVAQDVAAGAGLKKPEWNQYHIGFQASDVRPGEVIRLHRRISEVKHPHAADFNQLGKVLQAGILSRAVAE